MMYIFDKFQQMQRFQGGFLKNSKVQFKYNMYM
jgi:hypothetical protein